MVDYIETLKNAECTNLRKHAVFYLTFLRRKIQSSFISLILNSAFYKIGYFLHGFG